MYCILNPNIGLRSWWRVPSAYYVKGMRDAQRLPKEEFDFLSLCDGQSETANGELAEKFIRRGFIAICNKGERALEPWQKMNCDNRYFPARHVASRGIYKIIATKKEKLL